MSASAIGRSTPITSRANRGDERVRLLEEAILLIRGDWPAVAYGLCESVNRASGLVFASPKALHEAVEETASEALRLVEGLYGRDAVLNLKRDAEIGPEPTIPTASPRGTPPRARTRPHTHSRRRLRVHTS